MRRLTMLLITLAIIAGCSATPANNFTVEIVITDAATGQPLTPSAIHVGGKRMSATTFTIPSDQQRHQIRVEAPGYTTWEVEIAANLQPGRRMELPVRMNRTT
jgi:hypothetical protein